MQTYLFPPFLPIASAFSVMYNEENRKGGGEMYTWNSLEQACAECRACALCDSRTNPVFGVGEKTAEVMLVGEGPGEREDLEGTPFVGKAGQLLDDMLKNPRSNIYTVEKEGRKKLIFQTPWYDGDAYAGFMELSIVLPENIPNRVRKPKTE